MGIGEGRTMLGKVELEEHYDAMVKVNTLTERLRQSECLCLNCAIVANCLFAKTLFNLCCKGYIALMVTRCPSYE